MKYGKCIALVAVVGLVLSCDKVISNGNSNSQPENADTLVVHKYLENLKKQQDSLRNDSIARQKTTDSIRNDSIQTIQRQDSAQEMSYFYLPDGSPASGATITYRRVGTEFDSDYLYEDIVGWDSLQEELNIQGGVLIDLEKFNRYGSLPYWNGSRPYLTLLVRDSKGNGRFLDSLTFRDPNHGKRYIRRTDTLHANGKIFGQILRPFIQSFGGVRISLYGTGMTTITDSVGRFSFEDVPEGKYTILSNKLREPYRNSGWPKHIEVLSNKATDAGLIIMYCDEITSNLEVPAIISANWDTAKHFVDLSWSPVKWRGPISYQGKIVWQDTLRYSIWDYNQGSRFYIDQTNDANYQYELPEWLRGKDSLRVGVMTEVQNSNSLNDCRSNDRPTSMKQVTIYRPR